MPSYRYVVADVFTDAPLAGNPLAVFTDARGLDDRTMQALAREMSFSESVFVLPAEADGHARLRIFSPVHELPFAGHPVLGAAFVLGAPLQLGLIELECMRDTIPVVLDRDDSGRIVFGRMTQPVPAVDLVGDPAPVLAALGVERSLLPVERYDSGVTHVFVCLAAEEEVAALTPDMAALARLGGTGVNVVAGEGARWKTRMFSPDIGVEDPATGSAAGPLACHLARHGLVDWGTEIEIVQGDEIGRPSRLFARAEGGGGLIDRVEVGGSAVVVARGEFRLPGA